jgi:hypothetical protein
MTTTKIAALLGVIVAIAVTIVLVVDRGPANAAVPPQAQSEMSLITDTPEAGFDLAIRLARRGVTETQPDREVLHALRPQYANDPDALIATSQVIAIHFQTIAQANDYWR